MVKLKRFEEHFLKAYFQCGMCGAKAYRRLRPYVTDNSSRVCAYRILHRTRMIVALEEVFHGIRKC